jgi:NitT/TauT family transport system substrate-binding protein
MKQLLLGLLLSLFQTTSLFAADKMRVAFASFGTALSPAWVTSDKGFWKKQGIDVELIYLGGGSRSVPGLLSGSIELFLGSDPASYLAIIQGAGLVKIGVAMNSSGYRLMTSSNIRTIADLKGKVMGIGRGRDLPYTHLAKRLRDQGIDPQTDVKLLAVGDTQTGRLAALQAGMVQATMLSPPMDFLAEKAGFRILARIDVPSLSGGISTTAAFVQKNRPTLIRFLRGYLDGIEYMTRNKDETLKVFSKYLKNPDATVMSYVFDDVANRVERDLRPRPEAVRSLLDMMALDFPQAQRISESDYWDLSLLDEIEKSGPSSQTQKR